MSGGQDPRKGFDLLQEALRHLRGQSTTPLLDLQLVVFGQLAPRTPLDIGYPVHYTGHLHDNVSLRLLYAAADAIIVPSRQEVFGQTGSEAHSCGTPVVAFDACGLPDIVTHQQTGYLAKAFEAIDLAAGIQWVLADPQRHAALCQAARAKAVALWSPAVDPRSIRRFTGQQRARLDSNCSFFCLSVALTVSPCVLCIIFDYQYLGSAARQQSP